MAKQRQKAFWTRRCIHVSWGCLLLGGYVLNPSWARWGISAWMLTMVLLDWGRSKYAPWEHMFRRWFGWMLKESEARGQFTGATWLVIVAGLLIWLFPSYYLPAMMILTFGDSLAALLGRWLPLLHLKGRKSLMGSLTMGVISALVLGWFYRGEPALYLSGAGLIAMVELMAPDSTENLWVGLSPALFLWLIRG